MRGEGRQQWMAFAALSFLTVGLGIALIVTLAGVNSHDRGLQPPTNLEYDYVIIGSGAGGAPIAERLSRSGRHTVLVLEAGPNQDGNPLIEEVPAANLLLTPPYIPPFFWPQLKTFPTSETYPPATTSNLLYTGGRLLGGSTSINGMQYVRGTDWMREKWVNLTGDPIWGTANSLLRYAELETYIGTTDEPSGRGTHGPLTVLEEFQTAPQTTPTTMAQKVVEAITRLSGLPALPDYNDLTPDSELGPFLAWQQTAFQNGTRCNSPAAFFPPSVMARRNLVISTLSTALYIRFNQAPTPRATHVTYIRNGVTYHAYAKRRIILAAGINSPTILQDSGYGPGGYVYNNPNVGAVLWNHQGFISVFAKNATDAPSANPNDLYEGGAWLPSALNASATGTTESPRRFQLITSNRGTVMIAVLFDIQPNATGYVHPFTTGEPSAIDPLRMPNVTDNTWLPPYGGVDEAEMVAGAQQYICGMYNEFQGTAGNGSAIDTEYVLLSPSPAQCANLTLLTQWVQQNTVISAHHWVGQNRMGRQGDGISVTNSKGTPWGVDGLTIADATIIPWPADGNTQAPAYLIGHVLGHEIEHHHF